MPEVEVKRIVQERYAARAQEAACCGPAAQITKVGRLYTQEELKGLPIEVIAAGAGCGNPTALGEIRPGEVVLDLGSGGGIDCFLAGRQVGPHGKVIGVDMTPEMIALARKNAAKLQAQNVVFFQGELEHLPLEDASVDVVISNCVICLVPDKAQVFRESYRVLRPGGRLYLSDMVSRGELPEHLRTDPQAWASCVAGAEPRELYLGMIEGAGFSVLEAQPSEPPSGGSGPEKQVYSLTVKARKPVVGHESTGAPRVATPSKHSKG